MKGALSILLLLILALFISNCCNPTGPRDKDMPICFLEPASILATMNSNGTHPDTQLIHKYDYVLGRLDSFLINSDRTGTYTIPIGGHKKLFVHDVYPVAPVSLHGIRICFNFSKDSIPIVVTNELKRYKELEPLAPDRIDTVAWTHYPNTGCAFELHFDEKINPAHMAREYVKTQGFEYLPGYHHVEPLTVRNPDGDSWCFDDPNPTFRWSDGSNIFMAQRNHDEMIVVIQVTWGYLTCYCYEFRELFVFNVPLWDKIELLGRYFDVQPDPLFYGQEYELLKRLGIDAIRLNHYQMINNIQQL